MDIISTLHEEKAGQVKGGLYHKIQVLFAFNSNHIEGSRLTEDQTRYIFDTNTIGFGDSEVIVVDDIIEAKNHFRALDYLIDTVFETLSEEWIKKIHALLKQGTLDADKPWFRIGDYKSYPNEVGGHHTTAPEEVEQEMAHLLGDYLSKSTITFEDLLDFHVRFERIHPFQDGNGRVGRLILFKEALKHDIVPFIITDELKYFYYRGLAEWGEQNGYLRETCLTAQDTFKEYLSYFRISWE